MTDPPPVGTVTELAVRVDEAFAAEPVAVLGATVVVLTRCTPIAARIGVALKSTDTVAVVAAEVCAVASAMYHMSVNIDAGEDVPAAFGTWVAELLLIDTDVM